MIRTYTTTRDIVGPLLLVEKVVDVKYNELVELEYPDGTRTLGNVLEIDRDVALARDPQARAVLHRVQRVGEPVALARRRARPRHRPAPIRVRDARLRDRTFGKLDELDVCASRARR